MRGSKKENLYIIQIYIDLVYCNSLFIINFIADADQDSHRLDKRRSWEQAVQRERTLERCMEPFSHYLQQQIYRRGEKEHQRRSRIGLYQIFFFLSQLHNSSSIESKVSKLDHLSPLYCIMQALSQSVVMSPSHRQTVLSSVIPSP